MKSDYYLQYSPIQKSFDIQQMQDIQDMNMAAFALGCASGTAFMLIAGPGTFKQMDKIRVQFEKLYGRPS